MRLMLFVLLLAALPLRADVIDDLLALEVTPRLGVVKPRPKPAPLTAARRVELQKIAEDRTASPVARNEAFEALAGWDGFDAWLLTQLTDPTLLVMRDDIIGYRPVLSAVERDPEKWIPVMKRLLADENRTVRSHAANALGQFHLQYARADALAPLLPWLSNADWAIDESLARLRLVQSVHRLGLRESIPHLVRVITNDAETDAIRSYAAEALAQFGDTSGNEAMRAALLQIEEGIDKLRVIEALVKTKGLTAAELSRGLEAYRAFQKEQPTPEFLLLYGGLAPQPEVMIGFSVAARMERLQQLEDGTADASLIVAVLTRDRGAVDADALRRLRAKGGIAAGIAAVLANDPHAVLAGKDRDAQRALLAAARVLGERLPDEAVRRLRGKTAALDAAVDGYLAAR